MFEQMAAPGMKGCVSDYTVGYMWGTTGLLYNRAFVSDEECDTLDASYFFGEVARAVPLNHVYYPDQSVIDRCILMHDTAERNEAMLEMWSRVKGNNLNWKMLTFICLVFGLLGGTLLSRKLQKKRRQRLRQQRLSVIKMGTGEN